LLILDNLSTLLANGSEGASDAWLPMQHWLLKLRRRGVAVLLIQHAGANGRQRGTGRREDALDTVIHALFQGGRSSHGEAGRLRLRAAAEGLLESGRQDEAEEAEIGPDGPFRLN
jgi:hypothetical protein